MNDNEMTIIKSESSDNIQNDLIFSEITGKSYKWTHRTCVALCIIGGIGFIIAINPSTSNDMMRWGGIIMMALSIVSCLFIELNEVGVEKQPAYEIYSAYGRRVVIKTTPEQDKNKVCKAKLELEREINVYKLNSKKKKEYMRDLIQCERGVDK